MKKIVCTVTNDLTYDQRMQRICAALADTGYQVTLVGFLKKRSVKVEEKNFRQVRLPMFFKKGKLFYIEYNFKLWWWLLFHRFDIYCGIDLDTLFPVYMIAWLKRKPCVYDAHEYFTELPEIVHRRMIKKFWQALEKFLLPRVRFNYTVSQAIADTLSKKYHQPYAVIRNVPLLKEVTSVEPAEKKYILYQGALNTGRGLEHLMEAMGSVNAMLYIAGEGDLSKTLRAQAATLPHAAKIRFLGYVRPLELVQYTRQATLGINLVENMGLSYYYSLSNKFFDYIHAGIPQISMAFPEYKALNEKYDVALLIDNLEINTIATAISQLMSDEQLYKRLKENTALAKQELNWQNESRQLIRFYETIE